MSDIESIFKSFKSGESDKVLIFIYSYFIIGYLILFTVYEKGFLNLEFSTQIILSIGISFPIISISSIILAVSRNKSRNEGEGLFSQLDNETLFVSILYSGLFSIFYLLNHMNFRLGNNQLVALIIIISGFLVCAFLPHFLKA